MKELYQPIEITLIRIAPQDAIANSNELPAIPYGIDNQY